MSHENVEIVQRMYGAFHRGDANRASTYFDSEVVVDYSRVVGGIGRVLVFGEALRPVPPASMISSPSVPKRHAADRDHRMALALRGSVKGG
jgi:hypothetical protein